MRGLIVSAFMLLGCFQTFGQESRKEVCIGFPVGNSTLNTAYGDNAERLSEVVSFLESVKKDSTLELVGVSFCGSASPEGSFAVNRKLAEQRRKALESYVRGHVSIPDSVITRPEGGIAWELLARLTESSDMPHKQEAVDVLRNVPEFTYNNKGVLVDSRKKHLMELQYGRTWHYMFAHFFGQMRNACVVTVTVRPKEEGKAEQPAGKPAETGLPDEAERERADASEKAAAEKAAETERLANGKYATGENAAAERAEQERLAAGQASRGKAGDSANAAPCHFAWRANLLRWATLTPDLGIEWRVSRHVGIVVNGSWTSWSWDGKNRRYALWEVAPEVRRYVGKEKRGYIGAMYKTGAFNYKFSETGKQGRINGCGVTGGYCLPLNRVLSLDLSLGIGYLHATYDRYQVMDGVRVRAGHGGKDWYGPVNAGATLVWNLF